MVNRFSFILPFFAFACTNFLGDASDKSNIDQDGDGFSAHMDCNDNRADIYPGAEEICNEIDDDCDGAIDDQDSTLLQSSSLVFYRDLDGDGYGDPDVLEQHCALPEGFSENDLDCDDQSPDRHIDALEMCNGHDDDCDGAVDEEAVDQLAFYQDLDGDSYGAGDVQLLACEGPIDLVSNAIDCDDMNASVHPDAAEVCNEVDDNCNDLVDELDPSLDLTQAPWFYLDQDGDGFGQEQDGQQACFAPPGYVLDNADCDDSDSDIHPLAAELCDGIDNDCDPMTSEFGLVTGFDALGSPMDLSSAFVSPAAPLVLEQTQRLQFCGGPFFVNLAVQEDLEILGIGAAAELYGSNLPLIDVDQAALNLDNLILRGGSPGLMAFDSEVLASNCIFTENVGIDGGAIKAVDSSFNFVDVEIIDNQASNKGGAVYADSSEFAGDGLTVTHNTALSGGGFYGQESNFHIDASSFLENIADSGSALFLMDSEMNCAFGTSFHLNEAEDAAIWLAGTTEYMAVNCDFALDPLLNNSPLDIGLDSGLSYLVGEQATFNCQNGHCGESHASFIGDQPLDLFSNNNAFRGNVYDVIGTPTLDGFGMEIDYSVCEVDFYVFERLLPHLEWSLKWHSSIQALNLTGWMDSPLIGLPLIDGSQVMLGLGWVCNSAPDYWSYASPSVLVDSIGNWAELRGFDHVFDGNDGATYSPVSTLPANYLYRQRILLTRLDPL